MVLTQDKHYIDIYRLTSLKGTAGPSITGAEWIAIQEINNSTDFLPNYHFNLKIYDHRNILHKSLNDLLSILHQQMETSCSNSMQDNSSNLSTHFFPILLGAQSSSISTLLSPVASVHDMGLMSATSTSVALSETETHPYFYRTIASDALQSKGLIFLCDTFNWRRIVVVYVNNPYGLHLATGIQETGKLHGIDVTAVAINSDTDSDLTYTYAAKQIKEIKKYIIILVHGSGAIAKLLTVFDTEGLLGYPYFYLGVDGWIDSTISEELVNKTQGFIGTLPWNINSLDINEYGDDIIDTVTKAANKSNNLFSSWSYLYANGYSDHLYVETPRSWAIYAYDVMYCIAHTIDIIDEKYGIGFMAYLLENNSSGQVIDLLNDTIIKDISFIGASGHVSFDSNGDRQNGFFSFGNIVDKGVVHYIGYFLENDELSNATGIDAIKSYINIDKIEWPTYFTDKGIIPHSDIIIYTQILVINPALSIVIFIICALFICFISFGMIFIIYYRKHLIIKRGSWRMNSVMCIGCILSFISVILFGIDERFINTNLNQKMMNILCEARLLLIVIAFTISVMPLFLKTWRLVQIFNDMTKVKRIYDKQLFLCIFICILIDIILLAMFMMITPYRRVYKNGSTTQMDKLQYIQEIYGVCLFSENYNSFYFYIMLILWKFGQLLFGIYCALNVARIQDNPNANKNVLTRFLKFDETSSQLSSIGFTFVIICIAVLFVALIPIDSPSWKYGIISISILLIGIVIFILNVSQRIMAVMKKDTKLNRKYHKSVEQKFKENLQNKLSKFELELKKYPQTDLIKATSGSISSIEMVITSPTLNVSNSNDNVPKVVNELVEYVKQSQ